MCAGAAFAPGTAPAAARHSAERSIACRSLRCIRRLNRNDRMDGHAPVMLGSHGHSLGAFIADGWERVLRCLYSVISVHRLSAVLRRTAVPGLARFLVTPTLHRLRASEQHLDLHNIYTLRC